MNIFKKKVRLLLSVIYLYSIMLPQHILAAVPPPPPADVAQICDLETVFSSIVSVAGGLLGFAFFMTIVMGGIRYMFSGGDPKAVGAAKQTLTWGILGLAFFALSFTILLLVKAFTGVDVTRFKLCGY